MDLAAIDPPLDSANVIAITGDLTEPSIIESILAALEGQPGVLLSDAAPKLTGVRATDRAREEALLEGLALTIPQLLAPSGSALIKLLDCPEADLFVKAMRKEFEHVRTLKPKASRKGSTERYLLARGKLGPAPA